jgi:hypothetical protein
MHILFSMRNPGYIRNFQSTIICLLERGHRVHLVWSSDKDSETERAARSGIDALITRFPGLTASALPAPSKPKGTQLVVLAARTALDYMRYLAPIYVKSTDLRSRVASKVSPRHAVVAKVLGRFTLPRRIWAGVLSFVSEHAPLGDQEHLDLALSSPGSAPDLVCVTPLVDIASPQVDLVLAARRRGIPTALCVASWDNLTNKGVIKGSPDGILLWNSAQREEAITLHHIPAHRVHVTGAHTYDHWFDWIARRSPQQFAMDRGFPPDRPLILYLGSSPFIAPNEITFVQEWLRLLRERAPAPLRDACVLIRPHPQNRQPWTELLKDPLVRVWPADGANPVGDDAKSAYYDSLNAASLVVGINTSGLIEAGILGRAVYTMAAPGHEGTQDGTLHFQLLRTVGGGLLREATNFSDHFAQLAEGLRDPARDRARAAAFIDAFVRPLGRDRPAAPQFADALERLAALPMPPPPKATPGLTWRLLLPLMAWLAASPSPRREKKVK